MPEAFFKGRSALVTGATSGIGQAIAKAFGTAGMRVAIVGLGDETQIADAVQSVIAAGAPEARHFAADLRDSSEIERLMHDVQDWGTLDVLVNCAGIQHTASLADMPTERWDALLAVNLSACFHTMRLCMPAMSARGYGRVINIASVHGLVASVHKAPYVASKFGLVGLSKVAALEYASAGSRDSGGVTVNCICPGWVETPLIEPQIQARASIHNDDRDAGIRDLVKEKQPSARMTTPDEIGQLALWLCHPAAHNLTGASIPVDGAWTAQ
jgi:3-hydroxybutyrate dehydrogenase